MRALKGLEDILSLSFVHWLMVEDGWTFAQGQGVILDTVNNADFLHQVYTAAEPDYSGRVTVPILWDKQRCAIVNNEYSENIRMMIGAFERSEAHTSELKSQMRISYA